MTKQKLTTYLNLCTEVYDLSKPTPPEDAYLFYKSYVNQAKGLVLEPMCGTGRFLLPLMENGFKIDGFDASKHMLNALSTKAYLRGLKPNVWQAFIEELDAAKKYNLIFIPSGSFGLIIDLEAAKHSLKKLYNTLNDDGILVFEAETLKSIPDQFNLWRASIWPKGDGKMIIANFLDLPIIDNVKTIVCKYELIENHQIVHSEIEEFKVRIYDHQHLFEMLKTIGFREVKMIKTFEVDCAPDEDDRVIVYECRK